MLDCWWQLSITTLTPKKQSIDINMMVVGSVICGGGGHGGGDNGGGDDDDVGVVSRSLLRGKINTQLAKQLRNRLELYPPFLPEI